jgi:hypothetical protein
MIVFINPVVFVLPTLPSHVRHKNIAKQQPVALCTLELKGHYTPKSTFLLFFPRPQKWSPDVVEAMLWN